MRELHAWENGHHVGVFSEDDEERISFAYDANEGLPISLSLPRTGGWKDQAPRNFLDNLLPDNPNVRQAMREHLNASSAGVFDLLDRVDATGGLVCSLSPEPPIPSPTLRLITDSQIANEIDRIERTELLVGRGQPLPVLLGRGAGQVHTVPRGRQVVLAGYDASLHPHRQTEAP